MFGIGGEVIYGLAAGLGMLAWAFIFGFDMVNNTPPAKGMRQSLPEEQSHYHFKKAA